MSAWIIRNAESAQHCYYTGNRDHQRTLVAEYAKVFRSKGAADRALALCKSKNTGWFWQFAEVVEVKVVPSATQGPSELQGLMPFAFLDRLLDMRGALLWHQAKGMKPAMVPAIPPSVAMQSLRAAAETMRVTPEALDAMLDEFHQLCLLHKPSESHADNIAAKVAVARSVTERPT